MQQQILKDSTLLSLPVVGLKRENGFHGANRCKVSNNNLVGLSSCSLGEPEVQRQELNLLLLCENKRHSSKCFSILIF